LTCAPDAHRSHACCSAAPAAIRVGARQIDDARRGFLAATGRAPDPSELQGLVATAIDDEILYREALARGLDRDDPVVQRRLVTNMAFVEDDGDRARDEAATLYGTALALGMDRGDLVVRRRLIAQMRALLEEDALRAEPSDAELQQALTREPERFARPARVRLAHVLMRDGDAAHATADASRATELALQSERDLARLFGAAFARQVFALPTGRWSGPVASPFGQHLVLIHEHEPPRTPALDSVRNQVRALLLRERAAQAVRDALDELRQRYAVSVDDTTIGPTT